MKIKKTIAFITMLCMVFISAADSFAAEITYELPYEIDEYNYIPVLMYHHITSYNVSDGNNAVVSQKELEEQIKTFLDAGYTFISLYDIYQLKQNADYCSVRMCNDKKYICITFDDGYESNYKYLYPLLEKYDIKADISVITSRCYDTYVTEDEENRKMTWDELNEMASSGRVQIYNHSIDHKKFDRDYGWEFIEKTMEAEDQLDWNLTTPRKIHVFTYPNGYTVNWLQQELAKNGFDMQLTTESKVICGKTPLYGIPRITVSSGETGEDIIEEIKIAANRTFYDYFKQQEDA